MKKEQMKKVAICCLAMDLLVANPFMAYASNTATETQTEDLTQENTDLKEKITSLEDENTELKDKVDSLEKENADLKKQLEEAQKEDTQSATEEQAPEETSSTPVVEYKDKTTTRIVQQALNDAGHACGTPDGVAGAKTTVAIKAYQTEKGITVNGLVTDELLQSLNIVEKVQAAVEAEGQKDQYSSDYTYEQLARNPDAYMTEKVKFSGKVLQAETGDTCYMRLAINSNYDTILFVTYDKNVVDYRLLEDDMVTVYGESYGVYSYEAVSGATITLPWVNADIIEMQ